MSTAEIQSKDGKHLYVIEFSYCHNDKFHVIDLWGDTAPFDYTVLEDYILYETSYGMWKYSFEYNNWHFCDYPGPCKWRLATIRESGIPHEHLMRNDMVDSFAYAVSQCTDKDIRQCVDWYKMMAEGEEKMLRGLSTPIFTNITEEKGGNEMTKYLYHVILFNKETETIDFKEYIPAKDASDASMQAAQAYGKYDSNVHIVIVKQIDYSQYEVKK